MDSGLFPVFLVLWLIFAFASGAIASNKGLRPGGYFLAGLLLGIVGLIIAAAAQPARRPLQGWYADPWQPSTWRWWDGAEWTAYTDPSGRMPASGNRSEVLDR